MPSPWSVLILLILYVRVCFGIAMFSVEDNVLFLYCAVADHSVAEWPKYGSGKLHLVSSCLRFMLFMIAWRRPTAIISTAAF